MISRIQTIRLLQGDCIARMKAIPDNSIRASATDPPYLIGFMNKKWDVAEQDPDITTESVEVETEDEALTAEEIHANEAFHVLWLTELFRILMPGGIAKVFAATRTMHRLAAAMESVGFVLDPETSLEAWCYGSGFPKSLNISKGLDSYLRTGKSNSVALSDRPVIGEVQRVVSNNRVAANPDGGVHGVPANMERFHEYEQKMIPVTASLSEEARKYEGYGTALKPAWEPFVVGRKPL